MPTQTVERMFTLVWVYDPAKGNGDTYGGLMNCYGMGPHIFTQWGGYAIAGHTADAYGLLGGMVFDREKGNGIVYIAAGTGCDRERYHSPEPGLYGWEERLLHAARDFADF